MTGVILAFEFCRSVGPFKTCDYGPGPLWVYGALGVLLAAAAIAWTLWDGPDGP